jgi:YfiH family protein
MKKSTPNLVYGFSKVPDGNMSFVYGDDAMVASARSRYLRKQGLAPEDSVFIKLEHGTKTYHVSGKDKGNLLDPRLQERFIGDGLMTSTPGITLFLVVADCIGAIIYDPKNQAVGLIHAGRKGVEQNILSVAVGEMCAEYGSSPQDLILQASPSISAESYVFDEPSGIDRSFWNGDLEEGKDGKYHMDIKSKFKKQAEDLGILAQNISISPIDTFEDKLYYSHRRSMATGEPEGRFAVYAQIKPM